MKTSLLLLPLLACLPLPVAADGSSSVTIKQGTPACRTEEMLERLMTAIASKDQTTRAALLKDGCVILATDIEGMVVEHKNQAMRIQTAGKPPSTAWVPEIPAAK